MVEVERKQQDRKKRQHELQPNYKARDTKPIANHALSMEAITRVRWSSDKNRRSTITVSIVETHEKQTFYLDDTLNNS